MEKSLARGIRRAHRARLIANRRKTYWGGESSRYNWGKGFEPGQLGVMARTPCVCSCWMCGNPRRYWGEVTRAERISFLSFQDVVEDETDYYLGRRSPGKLNW